MPAVEARQLRVVSYNVHSLKDDLDALAEVVRELAPDVVIIQEAPRRLRWRTRCAQLAHSFGMVYAAGGLPSLGNLIVTNLRVRVHDTWAMQYPLTPGRHLRGAAFARASVGGTPFVVVGSHLSTDPAERPVQAQLLKKALTDLDAPVVFGGDLNETSGGSGWRLLADGLRDPAVDTGQEQAGTYPVPEPRSRIDALLVDPRFEVTGYRVADSPAARLASDHFPIVADLTLP
jgi:endonuclease/exonuclease/phosphatase family metal-dependent hydrolase